MLLCNRCFYIVFLLTHTWMIDRALPSWIEEFRLDRYASPKTTQLNLSNLVGFMQNSPLWSVACWSLFSHHPIFWIATHPHGSNWNSLIYNPALLHICKYRPTTPTLNLYSWVWSLLQPIGFCLMINVCLDDCWTTIITIYVWGGIYTVVNRFYSDSFCFNKSQSCERTLRRRWMMCMVSSMFYSRQDGHFNLF